jgi:hypothetical protein
MHDVCLNSIHMYLSYRRRMIVYLEYQNVSPFVGIGPPIPLPPWRVCLPPWTHWGKEQHSLAGEGVGGPSSGDWKESLYSVSVQYVPIRNIRFLSLLMKYLSKPKKRTYSKKTKKKRSKGPQLPQNPKSDNFSGEIITINVPLFKKLRDIIFFWWENHFMSHFEGHFEGAKTFLTP